MNRKRQAILILLITLAFLAPQALAEVVVIMRREANSTGKYLRVCDIARVDGPGEQAREVALVVLGPSPHRGETREITRWDIEARLFEMGIDARVNFSGNDMVRVYGDGVAISGRNDSFQELFPFPGGSAVWDRRDGSEVAGVQRSKGERPARPYDSRFDNMGGMGFGKAALAADARRRVELALSDYFASLYRNSPSPRTDIEVDAKVLSASADIPYSAHELRVVEVDPDSRVPGKATLRVKVKNTEKDPFREVTVVADTEVYGETLVAARHLTRGEMLAERDVSVARIRMEGGIGYLPPKREAALGREAKRAFKPGDPILAADAEIGDAVKRGSQVVVENRGRGWAVQTKAKSLGSGAVGDVVTVQDLTNKTKYQARIVRPGTVTAVLKRDAHGFIDKD